MSGTYVLDAFALLAYLQAEPRGRRVIELLHLASEERARLLLSLVTFGEAIYVTERRRGPGGAMDIIRGVAELPLEQVEIGRELVFAAALAVLEKAVLVTGDREFESLVGLVQIEWLPQ